MLKGGFASVFHASDGAAYEHWLGRWSSRLANSSSTS